MNLGYVDDSHLFCPRDSKRLMVEVGPNETTGANEMWHVCWTCEYEERDRDWKPPRVRSRVGFQVLYERRARLWGLAVNATPTSFDALAIRKALGREKYGPPRKVGPDGWSFTTIDRSGSVIVTCAPHGDDEWVHASIAWAERMPTYLDLKLLHRAVFGDGWAYQIFAPPSDHVNIHQYALHLWGRLDGKPALPDFTDGTGSI